MIGSDAKLLHVDGASMYLHDKHAEGILCGDCWEKGPPSERGGATWTTKVFSTAFEFKLHRIAHHDV